MSGDPVSHTGSDVGQVSSPVPPRSGWGPVRVSADRTRSLSDVVRIGSGSEVSRASATGPVFGLTMGRGGTGRGLSRQSQSRVRLGVSGIS